MSITTLSHLGADLFAPLPSIIARQRNKFQPFSALHAAYTVSIFNHNLQLHSLYLVMDNAVILHILQSFLPQGAVDFINAHILDPRSPVQIAKRRLLVESQRTLNSAYPYIKPQMDRLLGLMDENQGFVGLMVTVAVVATVMIVLNWIRRLMMWWTRLTMRIMFYGAVVALLAFAWERGPLQSARDMAIIGGKLMGFLASVKDIWMAEYQRYEAQQQRGGNGRGRSSGR